MRLSRMATLALVTMVAFFIVLTAQASAADEWLANGAAISVELAAQTSAEMLLQSEGPLSLIDVLCSWLYDGTVGPGGKDLVTSFLNLSGELTSELTCVIDEGSMCKESLMLLLPLNLPWETEIELMEGTIFLDKILNAGNNPGYLLRCTNIFTEKVETYGCVGNTSVVLKNTASGVEDVLGEGFGSETGECTHGFTESVWLQFGLVTTSLVEGAALSVS